MCRPVAWLVAPLAILLALAAPMLSMNIGAQESTSLLDTDFTRGYRMLAEGFSAGMDAPVRIVVSGDAVDGALVETFVETLESSGDFGAVTAEPSPDGAITLVNAVTRADPYSHDAETVVNGLRDEVVPSVFGGQASEVFITGATAETIDFDNALIDSLPAVFGFVLGLSFLLLMVAFRSLLVPLTSILMNILSVAAAYGAVVAVFQYGIGADLLGFTEVDTITNWLPVMLFCILFGLSMNYHVFLLSRVREHFDHTGDNEETVRVGLQQTGRLITGAALIMVAVFASFASGRLVEMQQMGFGLAFAVLIDATLIRTILVPAVLKLSGNANWYFPQVLRWLPGVRVEGGFAPVRLPRKMEPTEVPAGPVMGQAPVGE